MYIRKNICIFSSVLFLCHPVLAENTFEFIITNNKDIAPKMLFLDKLQFCEPYDYHEDGIGSYKVKGKINGVCSVRWTMADCEFPEGVYQEFSRVQRRRTIDRVDRLKRGYPNELKDKNYRYLLETGNKYCKVVY